MCKGINMTIKEKKIQIALGTYLDTVWNECKKLRTEGNNLYNKGRALWTKGLMTDSNRLYNEGNKLYDKSNKLFENAVIEVYGKDIIIYLYRDKCVLSNGQVFR